MNLNQNKMTAVEKIIEEINNELQTLEGFDGKEITGSRIALEFVKKVAIKAKKTEKKRLEDAYNAGIWDVGCRAPNFDEYYKRTFKSK